MGCFADVAQLVEHHLAKVRVAGSNPVVRSERPSGLSSGGVAERRGNGLQSRLHGFKSRLHLEHLLALIEQKLHHLVQHECSTSQVRLRRAIGAVWLARSPDTGEVTGSSPVSPTIEALIL